jgi:hypothetical protein
MHRKQFLNKTTNLQHQLTYTPLDNGTIQNKLQAAANLRLNVSDRTIYCGQNYQQQIPYKQVIANIKNINDTLSDRK